MKHIILFALTVCIWSCSSVKKTESETKSTVSNVKTNEAKQTQVSNADSLSNAKHLTAVKTKTDSGYKRVTIIREYYPQSITEKPATESKGSKEKLSESKSPAAPAPIAPGLLYKETTITEEGDLSKSVDKTTSLEELTRKLTSDSTTIAAKDSAAAIAVVETSFFQRNRQTILGGGAVFLLVLTAGVLLYRFFK